MHNEDKKTIPTLIHENMKLQLSIGLILFIIIGGFLIFFPHLPFFIDVPQGIENAIQNIGGAFLAAAFISIAARIFIIRNYKKFEDELQKYLLNKMEKGLKNLEQNVESQVSTVKNSVENATINFQKNMENRTQRFIELASSLNAINTVGITEVYKSRSDAAESMLADVNNPNTTFIEIAGISLNDFVRGESPLHRVWEAIEVRLREKVSDRNNNLVVRVLPIHPDCIGAALRSCAEHRVGATVAGRLKKDVCITVEHLCDLEKAVMKQNQSLNGKNHALFQAKLYQVAPSLFLFRTDSGSYVQQYYFWSTRSGHQVAPTMRYQAPNSDEGVSVHSELGAHFSWLWEYASVSVAEYSCGYYIGHDRGLYRANCLNVFNSTSGGSRRISWLLKNTKREVKLIGISLKSFFTGAFSDKLLSLANDKNILSIQILIIDPFGREAKHRSFREFLLNPRNRDRQITYQEYDNQDNHIRSDLFRDTIASLTKIHNHLLSQPKFETRLYDCAPTSFMLLVDDTVLVEQYHFGKVVFPEEDSQKILGKDMPLYEFNKIPITSTDSVQKVELFPADDDENEGNLTGRKAI